MTGGKPRLVVVSYLAHAPFSPRGVRTRALLEALAADWQIILVAGPRPSSAPAGVQRRHYPKFVGATANAVLVDKHEPWSVRRFRSWRAEADGAFLIGAPFSPIAYAGRRLRAQQIPYVVDVGDPWVLNSPLPRPRLLGLLRAKRAERRLWRGASGAVLTTVEQKTAIGRLFPHLDILVRPNGFEPVEGTGQSDRRDHASADVLRLAHFGVMYEARLDLVPFLVRLRESGYWRRIELHQFGAVFAVDPSATRGVDVVFNEPRPWPEVARLARAYDAALIIGMLDRQQLPSKAISYLTLPIPRIAVTKHPASDALGRYLAGKPGWLMVRPDDDQVADLVRAHVSRVWTASDLSPPTAESWPAVAAEVAQFVRQVLRGGTSDSAPRA